ncbi:LysE family translocator [Roseateles cavernae]|uniref:LysE family translocator n=1 Tax=Roseateles cavernae TaxID=3153578 RepID=UPI0032E396CB
MNDMLPMTFFALAASISPGPVNVVALGLGARHGITVSMRHVTGATLGFTLLLLLAGFGLRGLLALWPWLTMALHWAGILFLLYMAFRLARDDGSLPIGAVGQEASLLAGAGMQWLNPKAWLAAVAGVGTFAGNGEPHRLWVFAAIYFMVCYLSLASWALAGAMMRTALQTPARLRVLNAVLALCLVGSAGYLLLAS